MRSFPLSAGRSRLSDPGAANPQLFTPYSAHFPVPVLIERGETGYVLDVYRRAWGWALGDGRTLTRCLLGLNRRFDLGEEHYAFTLRPGSLAGAQGLLPILSGKAIRVDWTRQGGGVRYRPQTPRPITLHFDSGETVRVERSFERTLKSQAHG